MNKSLENFAGSNFALQTNEMSHLRGGDTIWDVLKKYFSTTTDEEEQPSTGG